MKTKLKLKVIDFNDEYEKDMSSGNGFLIKTEKAITKDDQRDPDGIFSPRYGSDSDTEIEYSKYSCNCGNLKGRFYEGTECPECHTVVTHNYTNIRKTGWIVLENYYLINPLLFNYISKLVGKTNLTNIIKFTKEIDKDGNYTDIEAETSKNPYFNLGMLDFYEKFDEVINYFYELKPDKKDFYDFIMNNREKVFINKIPIYSTILRPIMILNKNVVYTDINKKLNMFTASALSLNKRTSKIDTKAIKILPNLYQAQLLLNEIFDANISAIGGKAGHIRHNQLGNRVNMSARMVIGPNSELYKIDEIRIPYVTFLEIYRYQIINLLCKIDNLTIIEADYRWNKALTKFDKRIYQIIEYMVKNTKGGIRVIVNRNPTINYGSMLVVKIAEVKQDIKDVTMSISNNTLGLLAGDLINRSFIQ